MAKTRVVKLNDQLIEIDGKVRVERGPKRKEAVATEELLSDDVTAPHYRAPLVAVDKASGEEVAVHSPDAAGNPIRLGEPMQYLDWLGDYTWYLYELRNEFWVEAGTVDGDEAAAVDRAKALL